MKQLTIHKPRVPKTHVYQHEDTLYSQWFRIQIYRSWWAQREHITACFFDLL